MNRIWQKEPAAREPVAIRALVIVLGAAVLLCTGLLVPPLWTAAVEDWQSRPNGQECDSFDDVAAQRNCYDQLRNRATRHPAKGANAPVYRFSE